MSNKSKKQFSLLLKQKIPDDQEQPSGLTLIYPYREQSQKIKPPATKKVVGVFFSKTN